MMVRSDEMGNGGVVGTVYPERVVVVGDVHGRSEMLARLVRHVDEEYGVGVPIYTVGDLIDRGVDARGVLDICVGRGIQGVIGNHEEWFLHWVGGGRMTSPVVTHSPLLPIMGGRQTLLSYGVPEEACTLVGMEEHRGLVPEKHVGYLRGLEANGEAMLIGVGRAGAPLRVLLSHNGVPRYRWAEEVEGISKELSRDIGMNVGHSPEDETLHRALRLHKAFCDCVDGWTHHWGHQRMASIPGTVQVMGHTPGDQVRWSRNGVPIDERVEYGYLEGRGALHGITGGMGIGLWGSSVCLDTGMFALSALVLPEGRVIRVQGRGKRLRVRDW